jgi:hypothetical protein
MVPISSAEILDSEKVLEPDLETTTTEKTSTVKLEIEDVLVETIISSNAESMVDQTTMTRVLKPMSDALENHGIQSTLRLVLNSESLPKVGLKEKEEMVNGIHLPLTTSGITTTEQELFVKILVMVTVSEPELETIITEPISTQKLDTEDATLVLPISCNAESMVDQTTMTRALKPMSNVQENHG